MHQRAFLLPQAAYFIPLSMYLGLNGGFLRVSGSSEVISQSWGKNLLSVSWERYGSPAIIISDVEESNKCVSLIDQPPGASQEIQLPNYNLSCGKIFTATFYLQWIYGLELLERKLISQLGVQCELGFLGSWKQFTTTLISLLKG